MRKIKVPTRLMVTAKSASLRALIRRKYIQRSVDQAPELSEDQKRSIRRAMRED